MSNLGKSDLAKEYRKKHGDKMATLKLARILYNENKLLFKDVEDARQRLRYIEGKAGDVNRKSTKGSEFIKEEARPYNPYSLPESDETEYTQFNLRAERVLCLYDVHIPFHSVSALTAAIEYGKKQKVDCVFLGGDIIDCFKLSRFIKDPTKRNFAEELNLFKDFMAVLDKQFPKAKKIYKIGNHEERYQSFLFEKAKELVGVEEFDLDNIIKARARNVEIIKDKRITNFYGLNIIHGHEFNSGFFSPVNVARGLFLRAKTSAIQGHSHQTSEHTESNMNGKITTTWSVGCLAELHPQYAPINRWNHGFAVLHKTSNGFDVDNKRIYKGKVL
jgi:predicted phosphodiesterase